MSKTTLSTIMWPKYISPSLTHRKTSGVSYTYLRFSWITQVTIGISRYAFRPTIVVLNPQTLVVHPSKISWRLELKNGGHETEVHMEQTNISTCIHDNNKIPSVIHMFSGSGNTVRLVWIQIQMIRKAFITLWSVLNVNTIFWVMQQHG